MRLYYLLSISFLHFFIVACAAMPTNSAYSRIQNLKQMIVQNPDDAHAQGELADAYLKQYQDTREPLFRDRAIEAYQAFLQLSPNQMRVQILLYKLLTEKALNHGDMAAAQAARDIYFDVPEIANYGFMPPSFTHIIINPGNNDMIKSALKSAIKESPKYISSHMMLARIYSDEKHYELSANMVLQAIDMSDHEAKLYKLLGRVYKKQLDEMACYVDGMALVDKAITAYKTALVDMPDDLEVIEALYMLYDRKGLPALSFFYAEQLLKKSDAMAYKLDYADALLAVGRVEESIRYLEDIADNDVLYIWRFLGRAYFMTGRLSDARAAWRSYFSLRERKDYLYGILLNALAIDKTLSDPASQDVLASYTHYADASPWEQKLYDFHLGKVSDRELIAAATDSCQKTEAYFYVAMNEKQNGDLRAARNHLEQVMTYRASTYIEYIASAYMLKHWQ